VPRLAGRLAATALAALLALWAFAPPLAAGAYGPAVPAAEPGVVTVYIVAGRRGLRFFGPESIVAGEELRVVNRTDPRRVGPNTFSLVTLGSLPRTAGARRRCFAEGRICKAIALWHGVAGNGGAPSENPARAGEEGWDTPGSVFAKGDSWFTGERPGGWIEQPVTVDASAGPVRLYFMSAIHPWMHGSIEVLPATG
jgi:hypothetical protein